MSAPLMLGVSAGNSNEEDESTNPLPNKVVELQFQPYIWQSLMEAVNNTCEMNGPDSRLPGSRTKLYHFD